jgi:hypothetical protein
MIFFSQQITNNLSCHMLDKIVSFISLEFCFMICSTISNSNSVSYSFQGSVWMNLLWIKWSVLDKSVEDQSVVAMHLPPCHAQIDLLPSFLILLIFVFRFACRVIFYLIKTVSCICWFWFYFSTSQTESSCICLVLFSDEASYSKILLVYHCKNNWFIFG